ncbi:MAG: 4-hydroxy-tetrahydrodipicolinate reductase [Saprospiraceae bacterium]|nr:4-hydroxy-tetrahydrodipicolinate reductase [Saprospiraceae bacterium]
MNIAIIGYGKMGKTIEHLAVERGHAIVLKISSENLDEFTVSNLQAKQIDVAIEFTNPHVAFQNITTCFEAGVKVVSGSTAWLDKWEEALFSMRQHNASFIYASNFSVGVNLFFALNSHLAQLMQPHTDYNVSMTEIHHTAKVDAPSGTAVTLAEGILNSLDRKSSWVQEKQPESDEILIESVRQDPAPGTHSITYSSDIDDIEIKHTAKSRKGFALGAILAAEYLVDKEGLFTMKEVLGL